MSEIEKNEKIKKEAGEIISRETNEINKYRMESERNLALAINYGARVKKSESETRRLREYNFMLEEQVQERLRESKLLLALLAPKDGHFYEVCQYNKFWYMFNLWDILFDTEMVDWYKQHRISKKTFMKMVCRGDAGED